MKNILLLICCLVISNFSISQEIFDVDRISPYHEDLAAVYKNNQWGFINEEGVLVINYRSDLVPSKEGDVLTETGVHKLFYPNFNNGLCLVKKMVNNVSYYGYMNKKGEIVIEPQYINATNFNNGYAVVIKNAKNVVGYNEVLKKDIVSHVLEEYIIDTAGEEQKYLENPRGYNPLEINKDTPPNFHSKIIAPNLIAVMNKNKKWDLYKF